MGTAFIVTGTVLMVFSLIAACTFDQSKHGFESVSMLMLGVIISGIGILMNNAQI